MSENPEKLGEIGDYLPEGEDVVGRHKIGGYEIVTTSERINCVRKFPPAFFEIGYTDIASLQHITSIKWNELIKAIAELGFAGILYFNNVGRPFIKPIRDIVDAINPGLGKVLPIEFLISAAIVFAAFAGLYSLTQFIPSMKGYFRISRKSGAPVIISTSMTFDLKTLIREIESQMHKKAQLAKMPFKPSEEEEVIEDPEEAVARIREKLEAGLEDLTDKRVIMVEAKSERHKAVLASLMDILASKNGMGGVYLSITKPSESIIAAITESGIDSRDIFFIDCISLMAGKMQAEKSDKVVYVENPSSLEEISMYLDRMLDRVVSPNKFLFLDSVSSLLIYNTDKSVKEFTHYLINKIRLEQLMGVILTIEKKEAEDLVRTLTPMCDLQFKF